MIKTLALIVGAVVAMAPQAQNPDLFYDKINGFSIQKPPKNEEWAFKDHAKYSNSAKAVVHVVDELSIEILVTLPTTGFTYYDLKGSMENQWKSVSTDANMKNARRNALKRSKLPRGGAGNTSAYYLDVSYQDPSGKDMEYRAWMFIGKRNRHLYRVIMFNEKGHYAKHKRFADYIMGSFRSWKVK